MYFFLFYDITVNFLRFFLDLVVVVPVPVRPLPVVVLGLNYYIDFTRSDYDKNDTWSFYSLVLVVFDRICNFKGLFLLVVLGRRNYY